MSARTSAIVWVSRPEHGIVGAVRFDASRTAAANSLTCAHAKRPPARRASSQTAHGRLTLWSW